MAERVAYADPGAWLDDAARVFGRRIGVALAGGTRIGTDLIGSFIATSDAAALATAVTHGPVTPIADDAETAMIACRIADPTMLSGLPVTRLLATLALPPTIAPLFALMLLPERDARFATLFAYLQDDIQRRCLTPALAERLVDPRPCPGPPCLPPTVRSAWPKRFVSSRARSIPSSIVRSASTMPWPHR
jgi:hypothetical protein